jgi:Bacterial archaeo-eukaryotic release factor family 2
MRAAVLQQLSGHRGPFVSVSMDVSRTAESSARETELRWQGLERELLRHHAPRTMVDLARPAVLAPTGRAGEVGRLVVVDPGGIALDLVLPQPPAREEVVFGPAPHLLPVFRALRDRSSYLLAEVDRTGADVVMVDAFGSTEQGLEVHGSHDVVHKVPGGQTSQRHIQARAEDSWERNAAEIAGALDGLVSRHHPAVVFLAGDPVTVADLLAAAGRRLGRLAVVLRSGGRADGASASARDHEVRASLADRQRAVRRDLLDRFGAAEGRQQDALQGFGDVVDAVRRAQVEELFLHDDPSSTRTVWVGDEPLHLAEYRGEVVSMGFGEPVQTRADAALLWALVHSDAGITLLDPEDPDLADGVGALLRWSDRSTPHDGVPSMPGHGVHASPHHR